MLITEDYRKLNALKHETSARYGTMGHHFAKRIQELARNTSSTSILDYGCGKRTLESALGYAIRNYDPAIPGLDRTPDPADLVVCTDVLEHIEPDCLDAVLDDLRRVTQKVIFLTVSTMQAKKHLADGRNAHLIVQPYEWWMPKLMSRFTLNQFTELIYDGEFMCIMRAKGYAQ